MKIIIALTQLALALSLSQVNKEMFDFVKKMAPKFSNVDQITVSACAC